MAEPETRPCTTGISWRRCLLAEEYMRQLREQEVEDTCDLLTTRERKTRQRFAEAKTPKEVASMLNHPRLSTIIRRSISCTVCAPIVRARMLN